MITRENYLKTIKGVDFSKLSQDLQDSKVFFDETTNGGWDYSLVDTPENKTTKEFVELYFQELAIELGIADKGEIEIVQSEKSKSSPSSVISNRKKNAIAKLSVERFGFDLTQDLSIEELTHSADGFTVKEFIDWYGKKHDLKTISKEKEVEPTPPKERTKPAPKAKSQSTKSKIDPNAKKVEAHSPEHKFIKRLVNLHQKAKSRNQIRLFINALQKAIRERRITKTSQYAKEVMEVQDFLIRQHGKFKNDNELLPIEIQQKKLGHYLSILGKQTELLSVKLIKSYINLQGKIITNQKAKNLFNRIANAINNKKVSRRDKYYAELDGLMDQLRTFVKKNPNDGILRIEEKTLNGLGEIVGCPCDTLNGLEEVPERAIVSSTDLMNLKYEKLGLMGKWLKLIGNATRHFTAMIFGKPKMGKSYLAVDFAGYLAQNHGTVLYVAREEGFDETFRLKLEETNASHPDLFVSDFLPESLDSFDFVFLDSVTRLGLTPDELEALKRKYPNKAFIYIFQSTKLGNFRGNNEFQHDVDVVIEVPEKGKAVQFGRFNQGGEIEIFNNAA